MTISNGIFSSVTEAVEAANIAYDFYKKFGISNREEVIEALREKMNLNLETMARMTFKETRMGKIEDKRKKMDLAINRTPGTEDLVTEVLTKDKSMTLYELSSYGVVCAIQPSTNPAATLINNVISILAAGNAVIICPHPRAIEVSKYITNLMAETIYQVCGIENLVVSLDNISMQNINQVMNHPDVDLILSTGGSDVAREVARCDKKVISAGPANPTIIVDETADLEKAASSIVRGASFDNNLMCISEKNIVVVDEVYDSFKDSLIKEEVYYVDDFKQMLALSKVLLTDELRPNRLLGGRDVKEILEMAGIKTSKSYSLIAIDVPKIHPLVTEELLMPVISIVRAKDFESALSIAENAEQHFMHTAGIHSSNIERLNLAARQLKTSIFIKNGSSLDAIGFSDNNPCSFSIANISGEGALTARNFARRRRCVLVDAFSIR